MRRQRRQGHLVDRPSGERVEVGGVQRRGSADRAQRPRHRDRLASLDERAAERRVLVAASAAGVDDDAALEVDDRNDLHRGT